MSTFDPDAYWPAMGAWLAGPGAASPEHKQAEALLTDILPELGLITDVLDVGCGRGRLASLLLDVLPAAAYSGVDIGAAQVAATQAVRPDGEVFHSRLQDFEPELGLITDVLDVGCGRGRLASLLLDVLPAAAYSGVDIGAAQVAATQLVRPDGEVFHSRLQDFEPGRKWDLVIVSEVLMHIPPADIQAACKKVKRLARKWLVTVDWTQPVPKPIAPWNWRYDYPTLFGSVEREIPVGLQSIFVVRP